MKLTIKNKKAQSMERPGLENENLMLGFEWLNMNLRKRNNKPNGFTLSIGPVQSINSL